MKEYGFTYQTSMEGNYIEVPIDDEKALDEISMKILERDQPDFVIPFTRRERDGHLYLRYDTSNYTALSYLPESTYARAMDYLHFGLSIIAPFLSCKDWMTDYHYLCVNPDYVLVKKTDRSLHYLCVPCAGYEATDAEIEQYLKHVLTGPDVSDGAEFQNRLFRYFAGDSVTFSGLQTFFTEELSSRHGGALHASDRIAEPKMSFGKAAQREPQAAAKAQSPRPAAPAPAQNMPQAASPAPQPAAAPVSPVNPVADKNIAVNDLFGAPAKSKEKAGKGKAKEKPQKDKPAKDNGGMFSLFKKKDDKNARANAIPAAQPVQKAAPVAPKPAPAPAVPNPGPAPVKPAPADDRTMILEETDIPAAAGGFGSGLHLSESPLKGAPAFINLGFPGSRITIGRIAKNTPPCDIRFPTEFRTVGRQHACIERGADGNYYLIDLGSVNHTLINDQVLTPNERYPLQNGDQVRFGQVDSVVYSVRL